MAELKGFIWYSQHIRQKAYIRLQSVILTFKKSSESI